MVKGQAEKMVDTLITVVLATIMFSIGLSLRYFDFRNLLSSPRVLLLGLSLQLIALPALAFAVTGLADLPPSFSLGFLVLAACPGGLSSNFISFLLRANTALAVSLTICNSTLSMLTVPFIVNLALDNFFPGTDTAELALLPTALRIFLIVLLPVVSGMLFRKYSAATAERLLPLLRRVSLVLLAGVFILKLFAPADQGGSVLTFAEIATILPVALIINVLALSLGRIFGDIAGYSRNDQLTLGVEVGIQNTSLAFLIATSFLDNEQALKPALVYAMFTFFTALGYGLLLKPERWPHLWREFTGR
ncbi:MAG: bile acid:sodium symporter [Lewinella sp.]